MDDTQLWRELGQQFRVDSVRCAAAAKSGHPTSGMSPADLMAVLLAKYLRYDFDAPDEATNDRLIFSKGHASTLLYAMFRAAGAISDEEMMTYRQFGSIFEGHPTPRIPWVDVATGNGLHAVRLVEVGSSPNGAHCGIYAPAAACQKPVNGGHGVAPSCVTEQSPGSIADGSGADR